MTDPTENAIDSARLERARQYVSGKWPKAEPLAGLVLGSGWGEVIAGFEIRDMIPYDEIPALGASGIFGHAGRLAWAELDGAQFFVFQGRRHWYEGVGWTPIAVPISILRSFGARAVLITNAAGGIREGFHPGDLMLMSDHINLMGRNPLVGPHMPEWGVRYPDMTFLYDGELRGIVQDAARRHGPELPEGVYCAVSGPSFETPAEIRMLRTLGADAVGMSTVPEAILANSAGLKVAGISCITNYAAGLGKEPLTHEEVIETTNRIMPKMRGILVDSCRLVARSGIRREK